MKNARKIVFMGTAAFAVPSLEKLLNSQHQVVAVVTAPDKPAGRGKKIRISPVKDCAIHHNLTILQPANLKDPDFIGFLQKLAPDIQVVVAFRMLPEGVWRIPSDGTLNLHASLLPQYRGAAPINHAIFNGESTTGVSTFLIDEKIDTGQVLKQASLQIDPEETAGELHDRLMVLGAELVLDTVDELLSDKLIPIPQEKLIHEGVLLHPAPKIFKNDCRIDWDQPAVDIHNRIRGLSPAPGAYTTIVLEDGSTLNLKLFKAGILQERPTSEPGAIIYNKKNLVVSCRDANLQLLEVQLEGKRKMEITAFLRGFPMENVIKMD